MTKKTKPVSKAEPKKSPNMIGKETQPTASQLLQKFLYKNKIVFSLQVQPKGFIDTGNGFVMTDKPLLKITAKYANSN